MKISKTALRCDSDRIGKKWLWAAALAVAIGTVSSVTAETRSFRMKPQPLGAALKYLAQQSKIQIFFTERDVANQTAPAIEGDYSGEQVLEMLLKKTGLVYELTADNIYVVRPMKENRIGPAGDMSGISEGKAWGLLDEIIVTATRREENLQAIPMSVNAFSGDRLGESGIHDIVDLQFLAAGLQAHNEAGIFKVALRGIGSDSFSVGAESGVAVHRDGVYITQRREIGMGFFDSERIEVLRGPQGTLYGRNATGGAVNIISKAPTSVFEASGAVTIGNYDLIETEGHVSGPLVGENLTARLAFKTSNHVGYTPNIFNSDDLDDGDFAGLRSILRYEPGRDFRIDLSADFGRDHSRPGTVSYRTRAGTPMVFETAGGVLPTGRAVNQNDAIRNEKESWGLSARVEWSFGGMTLSSLTAYREVDYFMALDNDSGATSYAYTIPELSDTEQISQELTLASANEIDLQWLVGLYYLRGRETHSTVLNAPRFDPDRFAYAFVDPFTTDVYAAFGEASYSIVDRLTVTLGARYSFESKTIAGGLEIPVREVDRFLVSEDSWNSFTPKAALAYTFNDEVSAYATVGKGFKSGGYNGFDNPLGAYDPEEVINYEVGLKAKLMDGRLRANIAAFHMDYSDLQVTVFRQSPDTGANVAAIQNAATSVIRGVEFDIQAQLIASFSFDVNVAYLNPTFDKWPDAVDSSRGNATFDVSGNRLANAPEWAANLGATYTVPILDWGLATLHGEYAYKSRVFYTTFEDEFLSQSAFGLVNVNLGFENTSGKWNVTAWVKNLTDEEAASFKREVISGLTGDRAFSLYFPPRTYGITLKHNF